MRGEEASEGSEAKGKGAGQEGEEEEEEAEEEEEEEVEQLTSERSSILGTRRPGTYLHT